MSEQVRNSPTAEIVQRDLESLISSLRPFYGPGEKSDLLADLAHRLSCMVDKYPSWSWRYIHGIANGTLDLSPKFIRAVQLLVTQQSSQSIVALYIPNHPTRLVLVNCLARVNPGALILSPSHPCKNPACTIHFVPRVPWQKFCPACSKRTTPGRSYSHHPKNKRKP